VYEEEKVGYLEDLFEEIWIFNYLNPKGQVETRWCFPLGSKKVWI
jgi:hypothetical protein